MQAFILLYFLLDGVGFKCVGSISKTLDHIRATIMRVILSGPIGFGSPISSIIISNTKNVFFS